jgi:hypothetical protein
MLGAHPAHPDFDKATKQTFYCLCQVFLVLDSPFSAISRKCDKANEMFALSRIQKNSLFGS